MPHFVLPFGPETSGSREDSVSKDAHSVRDRMVSLSNHESNRYGCSGAIYGARSLVAQSNDTDGQGCPLNVTAPRL